MGVELTNGFSIVLCTYNGVGRLAKTLTYLAALDCPIGYGLELILVDNASIDNTTAFAKEVWQELESPYSLVSLHEPRAGKGYAVETGYDAAHYSYIMTVDDDNWLAADYLVQATVIFNQYPNVGILQGRSIGAFEVEPPNSIKKWEEYFIIGGPVKNVGYFPEESFFVWGAGMIIKKVKWDYIRKLGFAFLTSKIPGKAAGEDNETALALILLGEKIYYSDKLIYQHFMPKERVTWAKLRQNFETFGYVSHYLFLYNLVVDAYINDYKITKLVIWRKFLKKYPQLKGFTLKQHIFYWIRPLDEMYQLELARRHHHVMWFIKLLDKVEYEIKFIQSWMLPLLQQQDRVSVWQKKWSE